MKPSILTINLKVLKPGLYQHYKEPYFEYSKVASINACLYLTT
jgi:hypothetical protein